MGSFCILLFNIVFVWVGGIKRVVLIEVVSMVWEKYDIELYYFVEFDWFGMWMVEC